MTDSRHTILLTTILIAGLTSSCMSTVDLRPLNALGVEVARAPSGWQRLRSAEGWSVELPGIPLAERQTYTFASERVPALFFDLAAEAQSRVYLVRVFDAQALSLDAREELRAEAEAQQTRAGSGTSEPRIVSFRGVPAHDLIIRDVTSRAHSAYLRTVVIGDFVFQLTVIVASASGVPGDVRHFFDSPRVDESAPDQPAGPTAN